MGTPDHFTGTQLYGVFNGALVPVAVDDDGNLFALMKGWDGDTYVPIRLDADGRIEAVIKGEFEGTLASVALDDQGRLLIVPTDPENIWGYASYLGNAELAARLGSIVNYDYRGSVTWVASLDQGEGCFTFSGSGTGNDHYIATDLFDIGGYGQVLIAGSGAGWSQLVRHRTTIPPTGRFGFEFSFSVVTGVSYVQVNLARYRGGTVYQGIVRLDVVNDKIKVWDEPGGYVDIANDVIFDPVLALFNSVKIVIELDTNMYTRLLVNSTEHDLSAYNLHTQGVSPGDMVLTMITVMSVAGNNGEIVVGRWIETRNEPANA